MSTYSTLILGTSGLAGYWRLDDGTTTATDSSTNGRNGTHTSVTTGAASLLVNDPSGSACSYDGAVSKTIISGAAAGLVGGSMTIEGWARMPSSAPSGSHGLFGLRSDFDGDFYILIFNSALEARFSNSANTQTTLTPTPPFDGGVHYFGMSYDSAGGTLNVVIDGSVPTGGSATGVTGTITNTARDFMIGMVSSAGTSNFFSGALDEVAMYNVALSTTTLINHYTTGSTAPKKKGGLLLVGVG